MANLKLDLVNKINNDKFYEEVELIRLAQDPGMNYKLKIKEMQKQLDNLILLNAEIGLVEQYFPEQPAPVQQPTQPVPAPVAEAPKGKVHQGQSHGEG